MQAAYDFDFGNIEMIPAEIIQMIYVQMVAGWHPPQVLPGHHDQLMYFDQLRRVSQTISYAHEHNFGHGEFDWADFLLKVEDFDEFIQTMYTEYYASDSE